MGAPLFTFAMKEQAMASILYFLNEGVDETGFALHFLNEGVSLIEKVNDKYMVFT